MCTRVPVLYACSWQARGPEGAGSLGPELEMVLPHGWWDSNPSPLTEQPMLFTTESYLQAPFLSLASFMMAKLSSILNW